MSLDAARAKSLAIWDEMAAGWDRKSDYLWKTGRRIGEWMVDKISPQPGDTILELAAGPGMTGFVAAKLIGDGGRLISTDFSPQMVALAEKTAAGLGITNAEFRTMDAENIDLPDDSVDGVLCRWAYMLMMDPLRALQETRRVLKSTGKLAFSVWGRPEENPWATIAGMVMVSLGKIEKADPAAPGGIFSMAEPRTIERMLSQTGFRNWEIEPIEVVWKFKDEEELWSFYSEIAGAISILLKDMDESSISEVREALKEKSAQFQSDGGYAFPGVAFNVAAG
jgi:ubiquinone/menaquinone biosynthesis C-methylase UbiE